jgi:translation initiation factor 2B subunit (eIF-2B alpha/beta/delta family)
MDHDNLLKIIQDWDESQIKSIIANSVFTNEHLSQIVEQKNPAKSDQLLFLFREHEISLFKTVDINYTDLFLNNLIDTISDCIEKYEKQEYQKDCIQMIYDEHPLISEVCDCAICLDFDKKTSVITLQCNHRYHWNCLKMWLEENLSCPLCKRRLTY